MRKVILLALMLALVACKEKTTTAYLDDEVFYDKEVKLYLDAFGKPFSGIAVRPPEYDGDITITIHIKKGRADREFSIQIGDQDLMKREYKNGTIQNLKLWNDNYMDTEVIYKKGEPEKTLCYDRQGKVVHTQAGTLAEGQQCVDYAE